VFLEKAFAIKAEPAAIWRALTGELEVADEGHYSIEQAIPNELLSLWVDLQGGISALVTYRLIPRDDHTEVVATMEPQGLRYAFFRMLTLGRADTNYELLLVQGLANLKQAVEGGEGRPPEAEAGQS
jgi:hypothetical protein